MLTFETFLILIKLKMNWSENLDKIIDLKSREIDISKGSKMTRTRVKSKRHLREKLNRENYSQREKT